MSTTPLAVGRLNAGFLVNFAFFRLTGESVAVRSTLDIDDTAEAMDGELETEDGICDSSRQHNWLFMLSPSRTRNLDVTPLPCLRHFFLILLYC